ncbi:polysaccharide deacetylase family protein [Paenibacillus thermoaerophilus]|uniref:Polysaccharide deacetylase family protein n=1 Tax=Paenibacillus thermoaerophilus TaxID=1215385 RepID=A0ABW2UZ28_9BACL|nr:polysaccharide deacetylase family protein [Paenibacillus thermoaerophilus]
MPVSRWKLLALVIGVAALAGFSGKPHDRNYYESRGEVVWEVPMNEKLIALTFDDGPNPKTTPRILELLKRYEAKATFFVIGYRVDQFPNVVKREIAEGHEVANHTYNHVYFNRKAANPDKIASELQQAQQRIEAVTHQTCPWFRPPGGYYNDVVVNTARKNGYTVVLWSWHQDTKDWQSPGVRKIVDKVLKNARNGDIVLFHDHVEGSLQTVEALETILPELRRRGFRMVTVTELMKHKRYNSVQRHQ